MSRPYSWYPLAASDPVPGDPQAVSRAGSDYSATAEAIATAASRLRQIGDLDAQDSKAVRAVSDKAREVAGSIDKAHGRYAAVGTALTTYAGSLSQAQSDSEQALRDAQNAEAALTAASARVRRATHALDDAPDDADETDLSTLHRSLSSARADRDDADASLAAAREALHAATTLRDTAAERAADAIRGAMDRDGLKDSWWDDWGSAVFHAISQIAGIVAGVLGILSLVLCWVPILGQALAVAAAVVTAVKLLADIVLMLNGEGSWADIGWDAFALVTFGAGRVIGTAAKTASTGAQAVGRLNAGRIAATSAATRAAAEMPAGSSGAVISDLVGPVTAAMTRTAARTGAADARTMLTLLKQPEAWSALKPSALLSDVVKVKDMTWATTFGAARSAFGTAGADARGLLAASQGDADLATAAAGLADISPRLAGSGAVEGLADISPRIADAVVGTRAAVDAANLGYGALGGTVAVGMYDQTVGVGATIDHLRGGDTDWAIVSPFTSLAELWSPSSAERLNLR